MSAEQDYFDKCCELGEAMKRVEELKTRLSAAEEENEMLLRQFDVAVQSYQARLSALQEDFQTVSWEARHLRDRLSAAEEESKRLREALDLIYKDGSYTDSIIAKRALRGG